MFAVLDPSEVEEIKQDAPLHIQGEVTEDALLYNLNEKSNSPTQIRMMTLEIDKFLKQPIDLRLSKGDTLDVHYSYIPGWVQMAGPSKMDIMPGDRIEIYLEEGQSSWEPALSGSTVEHIHYVEKRTEHVPEPFTHWFQHKVEEYTGYFVLAGMSLVTMFMIMVIRKLVQFRKSEPTYH
ncbi:hypothetical protein [Aquibacillus koreensis]|uniref:hypothetical protein n=1 Tax=Aquibacillus koreensis TaxID=279446 RepID=UPI002341AF54|nr:hypothetical protein [Aquibacillus koreensis]